MHGEQLKSKYNPVIHNRRSIRLRTFDYASPAEYFVTICTSNRECFFGEIEDGQMMLSQVGRIAEQCWRGVPVHFPNVELDEYEVMPNHVHGIVRFRYRRRDVQLNVPTKDPQRLSPKKGTLSVLLRTYKAAVTTICREQALTDFAWQSRFDDRVIRDGNDLNRIRRYIKDNVKNWENDEENPRFFAEKNAKRQT